jgi:hypothetical protein
LVARLLYKDPAQRPQDARAIVEALGRVVIADISPEAVQLLRLAERHDVERAQEAVQAQTQVRTVLGQRDQAIADLQAIVEEGHALVAQILPDVEFTSQLPLWFHSAAGISSFIKPPSFVLRGTDASLHFGVWDPTTQHLGSAQLLAGSVEAHNRRRVRERLGDTFCEVEDGRLVWYLSPLQRNDPHQTELILITPETVLRLFASAMALPDNG